MHWKKIKKLGEGSYGIVHLASAMPGSAAAIKSAEILKSSTLKDERGFLNELKGCPNIIQCVGDYVSIEYGEEVYYNLVLEYAPGGTLRDLMKTRAGKMLEAEVGAYAWMLLRGLSHAHAKGIVHCDLKPDNILVFPADWDGENDHLKIADFGLAKRAGVREANTCAYRRINYNRGTLLYASPEAVSCGLHEPAADIWSLGIVLLQMMTGKLPWRCTSKLALVQDIMYGKPEIPSNISVRARDFLQKCLERKHEDRWTADMLLQHQFLAENFIIKFYQTILQEKQQFPEKPFGFDYENVTTTDLFSCEISKRRYQNSKCGLLPGNLAQEVNNDFSFPCGGGINPIPGI